MAEEQPRAARHSMQGVGLRFITGLPLAVGALALILLAPLWSLGLTASLAAGLAFYEFKGLALTGPWRAADLWALALALALPWSLLAGYAAGMAGLLLGLVLIAFGSFLLERQDLAAAWPALARRAFGFVYGAGLITCLVFTVLLPQGRYWLLYLVLTVVAADVGAYFAGHLWGRHKLAPAISPGKTVEGVAGGMVLAAAVGVGLVWLTLPGVDLGRAAGLAAGLALVSVGGDLLESGLKRAAGKKDAGSIFPGHGGLLDRVDGHLAAAPVFLLVKVLLWP
ncbi:MAG: phosphatidate cytidylyltransferase [Deltaproteobacteria bacterium]|nr:phosphatidate cytidylyltransferase [Deltaproteobacteria bacterium]